MSQQIKNNINEIQSNLTAVKVLVAILEAQKVVRVPVDILTDATNLDKEMLVDYDPETKEFIFRCFKITENIQSILVDEDESDL